MKFDVKKAKYIDLFAGIGGFRIALDSFGLECVYSNEWDKQAQTTYQANFGETPDGDITKVDEKTIPKHSILCGGFPCQAFSISGKRLGFNDTRGTLFFDVARIVKHHKPEVLFLENVKNFAKHDNGKTLETVTNTLKELNYNVFHQVLNAGDYGLPTTRERIYIIGFRKDLGVEEFKFPSPLNINTKLRDYLELNDDNSPYEITRTDIRIKMNDKAVEPDIFGNYPQKPIRLGTINNGGQGERIYSDLGHAITLSAHGGGIASKTGAYLVDGKIRKLSPRECANIMGFPKDYKIVVSKSQAYKQFGNSVAINVLKNIFQQIILTLN